MVRGRGHRRAATFGACAALVALLAAGCTSAPGGTTATAAPAARATIAPTTTGTLTDAERSFGTSPRPDPSVTYQPDVVMVHRGAQAVRSVTSDGLLWTMDGSDPDVAALKVGDIMLATSFATGRVARLGRSGSDVQVVLTPVSLTDLVSDADLSTTEPLALDQPLYYATPDRPGLVASSGSADGSGSDESGADGSSASAAPAAYRPTGVTADDGPVSIPWPVTTPMLPPVTDPTGAAAGDFTALPHCCGKSVGVELTYDKGGARVDLTLALSAPRPTVQFHLSISGGQVRDASLQLSGATGLTMNLEAATLSSKANFVSPTIEVPASITLPLFGTPIPMTVTITQAFSLNLQLGGQASFSTHGGLGLTGGLGFGYTGGSPRADATAVAVTDNPVDHISARAVAPSAVLARWGLRMSVGIGVHGFTAGVWYQLTTSYGFVAAGQASGNITACVDADGSVNGSYGVGYSIPAVVARVVNTFLNLVNVKPIAASGGPQWGPTSFWSSTGSHRCQLRAP